MPLPSSAVQESVGWRSPATRHANRDEAAMQRRSRALGAGGVQQSMAAVAEAEASRASVALDMLVTQENRETLIGLRNTHLENACAE